MLSQRPLLWWFCKRLRFLCVLDDLIHLRMPAQEAIAKWQCINACARTVLEALTKLLKTNVDNAAIFDLFDVFRFRGGFVHAISPLQNVIGHAQYRTIQPLIIVIIFTIVGDDSPYLMFRHIQTNQYIHQHR